VPLWACAADRASGHKANPAINRRMIISVNFDAQHGAKRTNSAGGHDQYHSD
jgi:hypothetical protein